MIICRKHKYFKDKLWADTTDSKLNVNQKVLDSLLSWLKIESNQAYMWFYVLILVLCQMMTSKTLLP